MAAARLAGADVYEFRMEVTGYCPCENCCGKYAGTPMARRRTASGKLLKDLIAAGGRFCAADRKVKFGTVFIVPGYGVCPVEDRGGAIKAGRLDLFFLTHDEALAWGRRIMVVEMNRGQK
jgi:3D (Asp-Asp-Asp) domain-containing protein